MFGDNSQIIPDASGKLLDFSERGVEKKATDSKSGDGFTFQLLGLSRDVKLENVDKLTLDGPHGI